MIKALIKTNSVRLPSNYDLVRWPPRQPDEQQTGYFDRFDFHTVFSDVFESEGRNSVIAVGPPYLNLREHLHEWTYNFDKATPVDITKIQFNELNRASRTILPYPQVGQGILRPSRITLELDGIDLEVNVGRSYNDLFRGRNALLTMSRDNHLENIRDWVSIHQKINEIDAVVIFDNKSKTYSKQDLLDTVASVEGIEVAVVVDWPHPYGVAGGPHQKWDSDFGQYSGWETARWRFFQHANSVMISDVDEIAATESGKPCWRAAAESPSGVYYYELLNVLAIPDTGKETERTRRHSDYKYVLPNTGGSMKYTYIPSKINEDQQLLVHSISGAANSHSEPGFARHFQGLHRAWRDGSFGYTFNERSKPHEDEQIDPVLQRIFGEPLPQN